MVLSLYCSSCLMRPTMLSEMSSLAVLPDFYLGDTYNCSANHFTLRWAVLFLASNMMK